MDIDYSQVIADHYDTLFRAIDPTTDLLNRLQFGKVISGDDATRIAAEPSNAEKVGILLTVMISSASINHDEAWFRALLNALNKSGQEHVANDFDASSKHTPDKLPMSQEHFNILNRKLCKISALLDPQCGIVETLFSDDVFTDADREKIYSCSEYDAKAGEIVRKLLRKPDRAYNSFMEALRKTGQDQVLYVINGTGKPPVREEFLNNMMIQRVSIVDNMEPYVSGLLDMLVSGGVINASDNDRICPSASSGLEPATVSNMNIALLRLLPRRPQESFDKFIVALVATQQSKVAQWFVGEEVNTKLQINGLKYAVDEVQKILLLEFAKLLDDGIQMKSELERVLKANNLTFSYVKKGCVAIGFRCHTMEALQNLRNLHRRKEFDRIFTEEYKTMLSNYGAVSLILEIPDEELARCETNFLLNQPMTPVHRQSLLRAAKSPSVFEQITVNDDLLNNLSMCDRRKRAIKSSTGIKKAATLFEIVSRQPDWAFDELIYAFNKTAQTTVIDFIEPSKSGYFKSRSTPCYNIDQSDTRKAESEQRRSENKEIMSDSVNQEMEQGSGTTMNIIQEAGSWRKPDMTSKWMDEKRYSLADVRQPLETKITELTKSCEVHQTPSENTRKFEKDTKVLIHQNQYYVIEPKNAEKRQAELEKTLEFRGWPHEPGFTWHPLEEKKLIIVLSHESPVDFRRVLRENYELLSRCLVVTDRLLLDLSLNKSMREIVDTVRQSPELDKTESLLKILSEFPKSELQSVFDDFRMALRHDGQEHVANIFVPMSDERPMSDEHYQLLISKREELSQFINPKPLLHNLVAVGVFSPQDMDRVMSKSTGYTEMSFELINILLRKSDCSFNKFIEALKHTEEHHVVYIITGDGEPSLSRVRRLVLRKARDKLISRIETMHNTFLAKMISMQVLTNDDQKRIEAHKVNEYRTAELIDVIARKSQNAYDRFIQALEDSGQSTVADELKSLELRGMIDLHYCSDVSPSERNRIVQVVRNKMKALVSGTGHDIDDITSLMELNGFAVSDVSEG